MDIYAWLVVNGFIRTEKFMQIFAWLMEAAKKQGCTLELKTNAQLLPALVMEAGCLEMWEQQKMRRPRFVLFWDKDVRLARLLEQHGLRLFNCADSIERCDDKAYTYLELLRYGVSMPKTIIAPKTFRPEGYPQLEFFEEAECRLGYPMVIKECFGSFGQQVHLVYDRQEAAACLAGIGNRPCIFQEYIACSRGRDVRIQMVGEEAVAAMYRYNEQDFRANITAGGSMAAYQPTEEQLEMARLAMRGLELDFAGVDILFGQEGEPILCEVNSNAHFVNICQCTGVNAADHILRHCIQEVKNGKSPG